MRPRQSSTSDFSSPPIQAFEIPTQGDIDRDDFAISVSPDELMTQKKEYLDKLAFNEQMVTGQLMSTGDQHELHVADVYVNGRQCLFYRDQPTTAPRKFWEQLISATRSVSRTQEIVDNGERKMQIVTHFVPRYNVVILDDPSPNSAAWLKSLRSRSA